MRDYTVVFIVLSVAVWCLIVYTLYLGAIADTLWYASVWCFALAAEIIIIDSFDRQEAELRDKGRIQPLFRKSLHECGEMKE